MQKLILEQQQSQIIIEAPFRNQQLLQFFLDNLSDQITLGVAINLMCNNEQIVSQSIKSWKALSTQPELNKKEVIFVLGT